MKNVYRLEYWRYHNRIESKEFTNKAKAQRWLKSSGWWEDWNRGDCCIYIFKNNEEADWICKDKGWCYHTD